MKCDGLMVAQDVSAGGDIEYWSKEAGWNAVARRHSDSGTVPNLRIHDKKNERIYCKGQTSLATQGSESEREAAATVPCVAVEAWCHHGLGLLHKSL